MDPNRPSHYVRLVHAALDQIEGAAQQGGGIIILRGSLDATTLPDLKIAPYQREVLPTVSRTSLAKALREGANVPDIELGMRGGNYRDLGDGRFELLDPTFIIDGLQRTSAGITLLKEGYMARIGAKVYFNTTEASERERFKILNVDRRRLSPNVLLRNLREDIPAVEILYRLTEDKTFVLEGKVCWTQCMARDQLIHSFTVAKALCRLHAHLSKGGFASQYDYIAASMQSTVDKIGPNVFRDNVKTLFGLIDECYGVRSVRFREGAVQLRAGFLLVLVSLLSDHTDFWRDNRLTIEKDLRRKLASFSLNDPHIRHLATAAGSARGILYELLVKHLNKGKTTRRLTARSQALLPAVSEEDRASHASTEVEEDGHEQEAETGT